MKKRLFKPLIVLGVAVVMILLVLILKTPMPKPDFPPDAVNSAILINPKDPGHRTCRNIWEYWSFIMTYDLPDNFLTWEQVSLLGKVESVSFGGHYFSGPCYIMYRYIDESGVRVSLSAYYDGYINWNIEQDGYQVIEVQRDSMSSMRSIAPDEDEGYSVVVGKNLLYRYANKSGLLTHVRWVDSGVTFTLTDGNLGSENSDTLFNRLTSVDHGDSNRALNEIKQHLMLGKLISLLANLAFMAIPVGAVSAFVILIYEKKKKKAAAAAPAEEPAD